MSKRQAEPGYNLALICSACNPWVCFSSLPQVREPCPGPGAAPEGSPARDLLQQCLWAAGITEQLLEAEARRDPGSFQPSADPRQVRGRQPLLQPLGQPLGPFPGPPQPGGRQAAAAALPAPHVVLLQQVPQRIILQLKQPGPTTLALLPSCVPGSGHGLEPPAHKATGHPSSATLSPCGHQQPGAAAAQHSSTAKAVGMELWHGESLWGLEPKWGTRDPFVSYF
ncbi:uncharacterized protein LOC134561048 [Prinia subflava]|uniref:uncharacterized protein LOC134561048 n=1 Tax=Prinia subflava TaxID=208062 RepID=UPI002FDFD835